MTVLNFKALLQEAKTASFEALPKGDYPVTIIAADAITSSTGKPMIKVKAEVMAGHAAAGKKVFNNFVISEENPTALNFFFTHMAILGVPESFFMQVSDLTPVAAALVGRSAIFSLSQREFPVGSGQMRNQVDGVKPLAGVPGAVTAPATAPVGGIPTPQVPQVPQPGFSQPQFTPQPQGFTSGQTPQVPQPQFTQQSQPQFTPQPAVAQQQPSFTPPAAAVPQPAQQPTPTASATPDDQPPPGFTPEMWAAIKAGNPEMAKQLAAQFQQGANGSAAQPVASEQPVQAVASAPAPPPLPFS
jgi:hypothetical protein